ncbi:MAG: hypothetical protein ACI4NA_08885 [Succinivibrio sp.]
MKAVIFEGDPLRSSSYLQGIAACSNLLDLGFEVAAFASGDFASALSGAPEDAPFRRQFSQLELFGAKVMGDPAASPEAAQALLQCDGALSF